MFFFVTRLKVSVPLSIASILTLVIIHNAAAYVTTPARWPNQPYSGCCLSLDVALFTSEPYDSIGAQNGVNAWNYTAAANVYYNWVSNGADWDARIQDNYWSSPRTPGRINIHYTDSDQTTISYEEIILNTYFTATYPSGKIQEVAAHELGHANGLGDLDSGCVLMNQDAYVVWDLCGINTPQPDDINGVNSKY